ncbi:GntR family transcriptional regulator [Sphaerisporangium aureirubrum]|uniref:GntR family transcriptional regulator n=1 Tax=Sphaerisporangium aureirubrum TaxID=1544736 RepID=A0ABW1NC97_9ACTN
MRIADQLRRRILSGELAKEDRLPSTPEIAREYKVARNTASDALGLLVTEGLAVARPGSGTYVRARARRQRLVRTWHRNAMGGSPFARLMEDYARVGSWDYESRTARAPEAVRGRLALTEPGDEPDAMHTSYVYRSDGRPVQLSESWEPLSLTRGTPVVLPEDGPHAGAGVVERMRLIGVKITHAAEVVSARLALATESSALDVAPGAIVLTIERTFLCRRTPRGDRRHRDPGGSVRGGLRYVDVGRAAVARGIAGPTRVGVWGRATGAVV